MNQQEALATAERLHIGRGIGVFLEVECGQVQAGNPALGAVFSRMGKVYAFLSTNSLSRVVKLRKRDSGPI